MAGALFGLVVAEIVVEVGRRRTVGVAVVAGLEAAGGLVWAGWISAGEGLEPIPRRRLAGRRRRAGGRDGVHRRWSALRARRALRAEPLPSRPARAPSRAHAQSAASTTHDRRSPSSVAERDDHVAAARPAAPTRRGALGRCTGGDSLRRRCRRRRSRRVGRRRGLVVGRVVVAGVVRSSGDGRCDPRSTRRGGARRSRRASSTVAKDPSSPSTERCRVPGLAPRRVGRARRPMPSLARLASSVATLGRRRRRPTAQGEAAEATRATTAAATPTGARTARRRCRPGGGAVVDRRRRRPARCPSAATAAAMARVAGGVVDRADRRADGGGHPPERPHPAGDRRARRPGRLLGRGLAVEERAGELVELSVGVGHGAPGVVGRLTSMTLDGPASPAGSAPSGGPGRPRPRAMRERTVPGGMPSTSAISA